MTCLRLLQITLKFSILTSLLFSCSEQEKQNVKTTTVEKVVKVTSPQLETVSKETVSKTSQLKPIDRTPTQVGPLEIKKTNTAQTCRQCHEKEYKDWKGSHHDLAMAIATKETVLGDFNNVSFTFKKETSRFYMKGEKYFVETYDQKGQLKEFEVLFTFGWTPLQQYMVQFPGGRLQCLHIAWDSVENKWFRLHPELDIEHQEWINWTGGSQTWNTMCSDCHSTKVEKNYDAETDSFNTKFKDINVSCEACHGPGDEHIEWALAPGSKPKASAPFKSLKRDTWDNKGLVDQCARCHARREQFDNEYNPHHGFSDMYTQSALTDRLYFPDGQILDEDYVYGSFVQSKMYHTGVRCNDCHNPHSLKLKAKGNNLCITCHVPDKYNSPVHSGHTEKQASCIDCHMTGRYYMVNDFRRDHSFRVPRPDQSIKHGTPNACMNCHEEKGNQWAADWVKGKYGAQRNPHYSDVLTAARDNETGSREKLLKLVTDQTQPFIARASAVWRIGQIRDQNEYQVILKALKDKEPMVRYQAAMLFQGMPPSHMTVSALLPILKDEKKPVRISAFRSLIGIPFNMIPGSSREIYEKVRMEYEGVINLNGDFPTGRLNLANYHMSRGNTEEAEKHYRIALKKDDHLNATRINLAQLLNSKKENKEAEELLRKVIEMEPSYPMSYYNLGLLLAEEQRLEEAEKYLAKAITFNIPNPNIYFNWGVILENLKRPDDAEKAYALGLVNCGYNFRLLQTLCFLKYRQGKKQEAMQIIGEQLQNDPQNQQLRQLMQQLSR